MRENGGMGLWVLILGKRMVVWGGCFMWREGCDGSRVKFTMESRFIRKYALGRAVP